MKTKEKLLRLLKGTPPRGRYTFARRFFQLAILFLFSTQLLFNERFIEGSLASSKVLLSVALLPLAALGAYHFWRGTKGLAREAGKWKYVAYVGGALATVGVVLALYALLSGLGIDFVTYVRVGTQQKLVAVPNYVAWAAWATFLAGATIYLAFVWKTGKEGADLVRFVMTGAPIFLAMAVVATLITKNALIVFAATAAVAAAISLGLYAEDIVTKDERVKDLAYAFGMTAIAMGLLSLAAYFVGLHGLSDFKYPMLDPFAWIEHAVASKGFTLESVLAVLTVVFLYSALGRFFCGWVCPMDLLFSIFEKKLNLPRDPPQMRFHVASKEEKLVPVLSFAAFVALSYIFSMPFFTTMSPVAGATKFGAFLVGYLANVPRAMLGTTLAFAYVTAFAWAINLVAEKVFKIKRFWCRYVCPIGALYGFIMNKYSPLKIRVVDEPKCTRCNLCSMACPMGIDIVHYIDKGKDVDDYRCFHCGRCVEVCPTNVLRLGFFKLEEKR